MDKKLIYEHLNIDQDAQTKLDQIAKVCNSFELKRDRLEVLNNLEFMTKVAKPNTFGQSKMYGKDDEAYKTYTVTKQNNNKNSTKSIELFINDDTTLIVKLPYKLENKFAINNLDEKIVELVNINSIKYFNGDFSIFEEQYLFQFDKRNRLENLKIVKKQNVNHKKTSKTYLYDKKQLKALVEKSQEMTL